MAIKATSSVLATDWDIVAMELHSYDFLCKFELKLASLCLPSYLKKVLIAY